MKRKPTRTSRPTPGKPNTRGGVLSLELVVVLPILLLVLLAVIQFSTYLLATQAIQAAALVGAREATLPGATEERVHAAVHRALKGWRFEDRLGDDGVAITPENWQDLRSGESVGVLVRIDANQAAMNSLRHLPGFDWTDELICGQYIMRKE
ncbi:MAG: pilus assembly protein [Pirellulales bacterium]|nr:pilus assembly protein [Pirellulales bacterium]